MFGFGKKNQEIPEKQILDSKIELTKLTEKLKVMLAREIGTARKLKAQGMKSSSNYSRIGIAYYLIQIVRKAYNRLDDITNGAELNELMGGISSVVAGINSIGNQTSKPNMGGLLSGLGKMQTAEKSQNTALTDILRGLGGSLTESPSNDMTGLVGLDVIERLINGDSAETTDLPADAVPIGTPVRTQTENVIKTGQVEKKEPYNEEDTLKMMQELIDRL